MKSAYSRRHFLKLAGLISLGFTGLRSFASQYSDQDSLLEFVGHRGYGPLRNDPEGLINLPKLFSYRVISRQGDRMDDSLVVPGKADGMATFPGPKGMTLLLRNHEVSPEMHELGPFGPKHVLLSRIPKRKLYDYGRGELPCLGGVTTTVFDTQTQSVEREFLSLAGTTRNCSGGPTPWGSWITCEETVDVAGARLEKNHGYAFEVPASARPGLIDPHPLKAMGRFNHEAVAVDPRTGIVYQTEDRDDGLLYRFIPRIPGKLAQGGKLQALVILDSPSFDTRNWKEIQELGCQQGKPLAVSWIDLKHVDSIDDELRYQGFDVGAARFARGEGMWFGDNYCYFACTTGGKKHQGQIFRYRPSPFEGTKQESEAPGTLELFVEPNNSRFVEHCDNLTMAPTGDLVVCEDRNKPRIIGITPQGEFYTIAENIGYHSEFAGATFSPDGSTLFVNIQHAGLTLAIKGPWLNKS